MDVKLREGLEAFSDLVQLRRCVGHEHKFGCYSQDVKLQM